MATTGLLTLLEIAKKSGCDAIVGIIEETFRNVPELSGMADHIGGSVGVANVGASRTIKGRQYKTLIRKAVPTVGFRNANEGADPVKSEYENKLIETFILDPFIKVDKAVADSDEDGPEACLANEATGVIQGSLNTLGRQFYYGRESGNGDAKGHPGLIDSLDSALVVDAGGTTADTGSSVWAVKFGPQNVQWVYGNNGSMNLSETRVAQALDANSKEFTAYIQQLVCYPGLQCLNRYSIGRIKKLTEDSGKGLTDARLASLLSKFPVGFRPDAFFATRRSIEQLRASRTATNATGAPAPTPTEHQNIPILATESILDTESLTL